MTDRVRAPAHAKINLFLRILARETSGYHQIETAFALLELADDLVVTRIAHGVELEVQGPDLGPVDDAARLRFVARGECAECDQGRDDDCTQQHAAQREPISWPCRVVRRWSPCNERTTFLHTIIREQAVGQPVWTSTAT
jgi:hypothetical protein